MLATLCFLADRHTENFCGDHTVGAISCGVPINSAALPRHISLGTPVVIDDLESYLRLSAELASALSPLTVTLQGTMDVREAEAGPGDRLDLPELRHSRQ